MTGRRDGSLLRELFEARALILYGKSGFGA